MKKKQFFEKKHVFQKVFFGKKHFPIPGINYLTGPSQPSNQTSTTYGGSEDQGAMDLLSMGLESLIMTGPNTGGPSSLGSVPTAAPVGASSTGGPPSLGGGLDDLLGEEESDLFFRWKTRRQRLKSALYLRLKNSRRTSKCQSIGELGTLS